MKNLNSLSIDEQWEVFNSKKTENEEGSEISDKELKEIILSELEMYNEMSVQEYTFYIKFNQIKNKYKTQKVETLFGEEEQLIDSEKSELIRKVKSNIWYPNEEDSFLDLKPKLIPSIQNSLEHYNDIFDEENYYIKKNKNEFTKEWNILRDFTSSAINNPNIGRNLNFIVQDEITKKYLGIICISSDYIDLKKRDEYINWSKEKRVKENRINFIAVCSTIVPTQPLGYNYVGGKLLSLLCLSDDIQKMWKEQYNDTLVSLTTTSLYGKEKKNFLSQYDGLKHWKKLGFTAGSASYNLKKETEFLIKKWLKKNHKYKYFEWYVAKNENNQPFKREHRIRSIMFALRKLEISEKKFKSNHLRGIYFSELYENTKEFLRGEIEEKDLIKSFDTSTDYLTNLWKEKYAKKRINSLKKNNKISKDILFYDDLIYMSWEEAKEKYLDQIGR